MAIQQTHEANFKSRKENYTEFSFAETQEDVGVDGDLAYSYNSWEFTGTVKETGVKEKSSGHVLVVSKRQPDGTWKWHRAVWNFDHPNPAET